MEAHHIERLIRSLGIGATYRGYRYLSYGVRLCLEDEEYLLSISKLLYPEIAKEFDTTISSVERDIRTVIQVCWDRGNQELLQDIALHPLPCRPTAGEFLDILVGHLQNNSDFDSI
ncbi:MAG: sporulation initiation factor Spo0A C-terminal domain-containing protein [Lachnospiraceae bacterium]